MGIEHNEHVRILRDEGIERRQQIVEDRPSTRHVLVSRVGQLIWLLAALIVIMAAFRFVLMLLAANPANGFTHLIYAVSGSGDRRGVDLRHRGLPSAGLGHRGTASYPVRQRRGHPPCEDDPPREAGLTRRGDTCVAPAVLQPVVRLPPPASRSRR